MHIAPLSWHTTLLTWTLVELPFMLMQSYKAEKLVQWRAKSARLTRIWIIIET